MKRTHPAQMMVPLLEQVGTLPPHGKSWAVDPSSYAPVTSASHPTPVSNWFQTIPGRAFPGRDATSGVSLKGFNGSMKGYNVPMKGFNDALQGFMGPMKGFSGSMKSFNGSMQGFNGTLKGYNGPMKGFNGAMQSFNEALKACNEAKNSALGRGLGPTSPRKGLFLTDFDAFWGHKGSFQPEVGRREERQFMAPTPLRWNGKDAQGQPLRWDTPGLTWNGNVPEPERKHMQSNRVYLGLTRASDHSLEEVAGSVGIGMGSNTIAYPSPPVSMVELQTAKTDFTAAIAAQQHGGTAETIDKNNKRDALIGKLRLLAAYVQLKCNNDLATLVSSGFEAVSNNHAQTELPKPAIHAVDNGNSGQLLVTIKPVPNAKALEVRYAAIGTGNVPGPWQSGGMFTYSRSMTINGLTAGILYKLEVRAIGGSTGYSDWSDSVDHMSL